MRFFSVPLYVPLSRALAVCFGLFSRNSYVDKILDLQSIDSEADSDAARPACQTSKTGLDALPRTYATATRVPG